MKNKDKLTIIFFVLLIVLILIVLGINIYKNKKEENIDRKIEYIFDNLTYDNVYNKGSELFLNGVKLLNNDFIYEKDNNNQVKYFAINNYNQYKKITNDIIISNTLTDIEISKYLEEKRIIKFENNYYIENYQEDNNKNYIGSIIDIDSYDNKYVYFKSINYYCENNEYIGILESEPNCKFTNTETKFSIVLENNNLRLNNFEDIKNIVK